MAFYPDELSPIEKLRTAGKSLELNDLNLMSMNRRQWKSLVLGKKDLGMNNFATIAEEKEEDMSSDGSNGANIAHKPSGTLVNMPNKKITFPKPRKYITSRVDEQKEEEHVKSPETLKLSAKESLSNKKLNTADDFSKIINSPKMDLPEVRQLIKGKKAAVDEAPSTKQEVVVNYALSDLNVDKQWKDGAMTPPMLLGWPKQDDDKPKPKEEKKRTPPVKTVAKKQEPKRMQQETEPKHTKAQTGNEKNKSLNMKDVVNVYKNLAYGSKDDIKSFVEKLTFVKDEEKAESNKNLLSMMNLKALETKIKDLEKKSGSGGSQPRKRGKTGKKARKAHTENLARHKVVKVPATLDYTYSPESKNVSYGSGSNTEQKRKSSEEKVPWKYVGTQSVLDKTYFVYPSYPQPERKKPIKKSDGDSKKVKKDASEVSPKVKPPQTKVKQSKEILIRPNLSTNGSRSANAFALSANRSSATTVCTIEFRPEPERKSFASPDQSLLVYLHGTKATYIKSPYSDKQFSRVKFFRKDGLRVPLIRGVVAGDLRRDPRVQSVCLPDKLNSDRLYDLIDFDEDIQNINEFLRSQNRSGGLGPGKRKPKTSPKRGSRRGAPSNELLIDEISQDIESLQYLPDTEENRQIIGHFFDELDRRIERSKICAENDNNNNNANNNANNNSNNNCLIPIVGY